MLILLHRSNTLVMITTLDILLIEQLEQHLFVKCGFEPPIPFKERNSFFQSQCIQRVTFDLRDKVQMRRVQLNRFTSLHMGVCEVKGFVLLTREKNSFMGSRCLK